VDVDEQQVQAQVEFEKLWEQGQLSGWEDATGVAEGGEGIWCAACKCTIRVRAAYL
jgi:splicing factor 3A subunit 3